MLRVIFSLSQTPLKSLSQTLLSLSPLLSSPNPNPINSSPPTNSTVFSSFSNSSSKHKPDEDDDDEEFESNRDPKGPPKLFVIQPRLRPDTLLQSKLSEALNLAISLEEQRDEEFGEEVDEKKVPPHLIVQNPAARSVKAHADTYFGQGTVETVKCHLNAAESQDGLDAVFVNTILSGIQQRNLERAWGRPVLDRVGLIIEIFNAHAQTKEAKLQSELAALMYRRTRLVRIRGPDGRLTFGAAGEAEVVSARGRGTGGRGFMGGAGEAELQLQRRRVLERRSHLRAQIEEVRRTRALQRSARKRRGGSNGQGLATVAVVGYTNTGKSTLVGALSDSDLYSDDRLFATVDPRLRSVILPSGKKVLVSDTVGFISDLPVQLVEAFHATLEEVVEADLLVHVLDSSAPNVDEQRLSVLQVLRQIGVSEEKLQNMIEVWNKVDLLEKETGTYDFLGQSQDDNECGSVTDAEDDDVSFKQPSGEPIDEDDLASELSYRGVIGHCQDESLEDMNDMGSDQSPGESIGQDRITSDWSHGEPIDGPVASDLLPGGTLDGQKGNFLEEMKMIDKGAHSQPPDVQHVKVSATVGVGLQQLLHLIDEKLNTQESSGKMSFDRKWRPPYTADSGTAVEH